MADDGLRQRLQQLVDAETNGDESVECREELVKVVCRLFRRNPRIAIERGTGEALWESQKRLYQRMKSELDKQMVSRSAANGTCRELHLRVAKMNCDNVLFTLYAEWAQLAMLLEDSDRDEPISLLPANKDIVSRICSLAGDDTRKKFAHVLYSHLCEISEWKGEKALSHTFSNAAREIGEET